MLFICVLRTRAGLGTEFSIDTTQFEDGNYTDISLVALFYGAASEPLSLPFHYFGEGKDRRDRCLLVALFAVRVTQLYSQFVFCPFLLSFSFVSLKLVVFYLSL